MGGHNRSCVSIWMAVQLSVRMCNVAHLATDSDQIQCWRSRPESVQRIYFSSHRCHSSLYQPSHVSALSCPFAHTYKGRFSRNFVLGAFTKTCREYPHLVKLLTNHLIHFHSEIYFTRRNLHVTSTQYLHLPSYILWTPTKLFSDVEIVSRMSP